MVAEGVSYVLVLLAHCEVCVRRKKRGWIELFDFKGNLLKECNQLVVPGTINWNENAPLEPDLYTVENSYDALNPIVSITHPNSSVETTTYPKANKKRRYLSVFTMKA
jgi:hypothetical protein